MGIIENTDKPSSGAGLMVCSNKVQSGSPSRILIVLLISFGITTRPRSSIRLTIPVAFIIRISFIDGSSESAEPYILNLQLYFARRVEFLCKEKGGNIDFINKFIYNKNNIKKIGFM